MVLQRKKEDGAFLHTFACGDGVVEYVSQSARWNSVPTESDASVGGTSEMISSWRTFSC